MGLAQTIERPRNWLTISQSLADDISITENGQFISLGFANFSGSEFTRQIIFPYDIVIERMGFWFLANSLDALSVNTLTLRVNAADTAQVLTLTDATPTAALVEITGLNQNVPADDVVTCRWNSDSVGSIGFRIITFSYRIVNPRA